MRPSDTRLPRRARSALLAAALLALAAGCSRCGQAQVAGPERVLPGDVAGAFLIPQLGAAVRQVAALQTTLAALPGGEDLAGARAALTAQLGFDLLDPVSIAAAGLDEQRGAALALLAPGGDGRKDRVVLVVPVKDAAKVEALVAQLARDRAGASERSKENANGRAIDVWRRAAGAPAVLSLAQLDGQALVAAGPGGPDALQSLLKLDPGLSLEKSPSWQRARAVLGEGLAAQLWIPPGSAALEDAPLKEGQALGASAAAREARLIGVALLGAHETALRPLAGPGGGVTRPLVISPDAMLVARLSAAPARALALALEAAPDAAPPEEARALVEAMEPGLDLGVGLSTHADFSAALAAPAADTAFRALVLELTAPLRAGATVAPALDALVKKAGGQGKDGRWRVPLGKAGAEVGVALAGATLAVGVGPRGTLDALLARLGGKGPGFAGPTRASADALAGGLGGAVFHGENLARAIRALPDETWGGGPDGVTLRSAAQKLAAPGGTGTASLRADLPQGALRLLLTLELPEPPKTP